MARASNPSPDLSVLDETEELWGAALGARAGDRLEALVAFFDAYEAALFPAVGQPPLDPAPVTKRERAFDFA